MKNKDKYDLRNIWFMPEGESIVVWVNIPKHKKHKAYSERITKLKVIENNPWITLIYWLEEEDDKFDSSS